MRERVYLPMRQNEEHDEIKRSLTDPVLCDKVPDILAPVRVNSAGGFIQDDSL